MKALLKYLGIIAMLIGVALLAFYHFNNYPGNGLLITAAILIVAGFLGHIVLNKYIE